MHTRFENHTGNTRVNALTLKHEEYFLCFPSLWIRKKIQLFSKHNIYMYFIRAVNLLPKNKPNKNNKYKTVKFPALDYMQPGDIQR